MRWQDRAATSSSAWRPPPCRPCAGIPTPTAQLDPRTQLWSYENKYERTGGLEITLPIIGGGIAAGGSGSYCHALVRIVDGKVAGVTYAGDNDDYHRAGWRVCPYLPRLPARAGKIAPRALLKRVRPGARHPAQKAHPRGSIGWA